MTQSFDPFPVADLETNRAGRLSDEQRQRYRGAAGAFLKNEMFVAIGFFVIAAILATATGPAPNAWLRPFAAAAFVAIGILLLLRAVTKGDSLAADVRAGRVETVEGALGKRRINTGGGRSSGTSYYFDVAGKSYEVGRAAYDAAPEAGIVRLFVLPRSHRVVNLERLPDCPLPNDAITSPTAALAALATTLRSHDRVQAAEAHAELEAIEDKFRAEHDAMFAPAPGGELDPRPLAVAILGRWQTGPISMVFMPDGTMVATLPGGQQRRGHWSIGSDGRLHSDATGRDQAADASIAGDVLTVTENGQPLSFQRAAGN
jgi:hypothetical protein